MTISGIVEKLFVENTSYTTPDQATNQASSLDALSTDLYTDSKRFIYELLQNADDSPEKGVKVKVWIKAFDNVLVVAHSGKAFDERDVQGLCNINNGTKKSDSKKTGYKGIGFKSVFGQSERVVVFTKNEYFRFDASFSIKWRWEIKRETWESQSGRKFIHPWQIIPIYTDPSEVSEPIHQYLQSVNASVATIVTLINVADTILAVQELSENVNMFLFLKNIYQITFEINGINYLEINRSEKSDIELKKNGQLAARWQIRTLHLDVPVQLRADLKDERNIPEKLLNAENVELTLAAKIVGDEIVELVPNEKRIYSYLPTEESKYPFPVLVNTSFLTNANREHLHADSIWNQWLFKRIAVEIFRWISLLVIGPFQFQAYRLIPRQMISDELGSRFNAGIEEALSTVEFVVANDNRLIKVENSIVDFTHLSQKEFIGEEPIRTFLNDLEKISPSLEKEFAKNSGFGSKIKLLGADSFEWRDVPRLLSTSSFLKSHTIKKNIELIKHLKILSEKDSEPAVSVSVVSKWPFIFDHKNRLSTPAQIYFPTADDTSWNDPDSELAFLHLDIQIWLSSDPDIRSWIDQLGVIEKTDISFITKTLIPNSERYITKENAIHAIRDIFNLYKKGELSFDLLTQLCDLKLLTKGGDLLAAKNCVLSNDYSPRAKIENALDSDVFISNEYINDTNDIDEWKRFFKLLTVADGIVSIKYEDNVSRVSLVAHGFKNEYFDARDKRFRPFQSIFISDLYGDFSSLSFIHNTIDNHAFSKLFWADVIGSFNPLELSNPAIAFWGNFGMPGRTTGSEVENYIQWTMRNLHVIPVLTQVCTLSANVLLNTNEIKKISGEYLPVFDGDELSADWKSFFKFRTELRLEDYLELLEEISKDISEDEKVKKGNVQRIQLIYKQLMDLCVNWGLSELKSISDWANSGQLMNTKNGFSDCTSTKYFFDGNESIFQDQFVFLEINYENRRHPNIIEFLRAFQVTVLDYCDFRLAVEKADAAKSLTDRLESVIPLFGAWIESESGDDKIQHNLTELNEKLSTLNIYEAEKLQITYEEIDFTKSVNVHLDGEKLYVTKPWYSNKVLLQLPDMLCRYFNLNGHDRKLNFLMSSTFIEISEYFEQEGIEMPANPTSQAKLGVGHSSGDQTQPLPTDNVKSFDEIEAAISNGTSPIFFHISIPEYQRLLFVKRLISRAVANIISYLDSLPEYDCTNHFEIAPSIIGGVTKNGHDLTVVARPSDNDAVLIYYTSEFDVLEYVDAEFWCEDGESVPQKITMGHLLKMTKINRIPITKFKFEKQEFNQFVLQQKSVDFEFDPIPSSPFRVAQIISSFANTHGGSLVYGIASGESGNQFVAGLSADFRMDEITKRALLMISPLPAITYDWVSVDGKNVFIIKVEKSDEETLLGGKKYIRENSQTFAPVDRVTFSIEPLAISDIEKTVAIVIGIENYKPREISSQVPPVLYAEKDALLFKSMLIERFHVAEEDIHLYINENALKSDLEYGLGGLFHSLTEKDRLVFYYVGHGFHNGTTNYLSTYDTHINNVANTAVSLRKILLDPLLNSKCRSGLVFIDACAQSFKNEQERALITDLNSEDFLLFKSEHPHFATFLSCEPGQSSYSCHDLGHGIWTHYLSRALSGKEVKVFKSGKYLTDRALSDYLAQSVSDYAKDIHGFEQYPKAILDSNCENILIEI